MTSFETTVASDQETAETGSRPRGPLALLWRLALLAAAAIVSLLALVLLVPDQTDYALATLLKHDRLAHTTGRRIILVGGSNLPYGVESPVIGNETGCAIVNMGMNGYLGPRYMLEEIKPDLRRGDVVVLAFEWDTFGRPANGDGKDLFAIVKANPAAFRFLNWDQRLSVIEALPYVAQMKMLRLIRNPYEALFGVDDPTSIFDIETLKSFSPMGDLVAHAGITWTGVTEQGIDLTGIGINQDVIRTIKQFAKEMDARGVSVLLSYTPTMNTYYESHRSVIEEVHREMTSAPDAVRAPSPPSTFVYAPDAFFDTVYHLKAERRVPRTQKIVADIAATFGNEAFCPKTAEEPK